MKNVINERFLPQARVAIDTCNKGYGLAILDSVSSWASPKLGANIDVSSNIEQLSITPTESIVSCMLRCINCDKAIRDEGVTVEDQSKQSSMMWVSVRNAHKRSTYNKPIKGGRALQRTYAQVATPASE